MFCKFLFEQAQFSGVEVLSYCIMSNHIHLLLRVPLLESLPDAELLRRYTDYYGLEKLPRSSYSVAELKDILARAPFRVGVAPLPSGPAGRVTLATTDGFGIYAGTQHPEEAWQLLKFLISDDYALAMARANFLQPAKASLVEEWANVIRRQFPEAAAEMDIAAFADGHVKGYSVTAEVFPNMADARPLAYAAWDSILTLGQGGVEQMANVCDQIQAAQPAG